MDPTATSSVLVEELSDDEEDAVPTTPAAAPAAEPAAAAPVTSMAGIDVFGKIYQFTEVRFLKILTQMFKELGSRRVGQRGSTLLLRDLPEFREAQARAEEFASAHYVEDLRSVTAAYYEEASAARRFVKLSSGLYEWFMGSEVKGREPHDSDAEDDNEEEEVVVDAKDGEEGGPTVTVVPRHQVSNILSTEHNQIKIVAFRYAQEAGLFFGFDMTQYAGKRHGLPMVVCHEFLATYVQKLVFMGALMFMMRNLPKKLTNNLFALVNEIMQESPAMMRREMSVKSIQSMLNQDKLQTLVASSTTPEERLRMEELEATGRFNETSLQMITNFLAEAFKNGEYKAIRKIVFDGASTEPLINVPSAAAAEPTAEPTAEPVAAPAPAPAAAPDRVAEFSRDSLRKKNHRRAAGSRK